ncbi:hypothetical protein PG985_010537 [Apiospora marii]|uniref:Uncharacterized protein n=1 Tax=Apiospora marii TaxID=335849 RepID=A0ABR1T172_9PEZI
MTGIIDDVKSGLKGIRGAGDAIRGTAMEKTDEVFDNDNNHPQTQVSQAQHRGLVEKGKQDIAGTDHMVARHEQKHGKQTATGGAAAAASEPVASSTPKTANTTTAGTTPSTGTAPSTTTGTGVGGATETGTTGANSHVV